MNAIQSNACTEAWNTIGRTIPKPRGIVAVSAHWYIEGTRVTTMPAPRTIHDFGGFPRELYSVRYPAPGDPALARRVQSLLAPLVVEGDEEWGLDHGTWSVLRHLFPDADVPVIQLSIDEREPAPFHHQIGRRLAPLREEGVLVLGSGNVVHNLHAYAWGQHAVEPYAWAVQFESRIRQCIEAGDDAPLIAYESLGPEAMLSVPTPEHYLPLLYVLGLRRPGELVRFPVEGFDGGSVSMLAVQVG
jgi:4,5-DOPA dioxygenase extradiol